MAKKRKTKTGNSAVAPKTETKIEPPLIKKRGFSGTLLIFAAGFALAFLLAWMFFSRGERTKPAPAKEEARVKARVLAKEDMAEFFKAVDNGDYPGMVRLGKELFQPGTIISDSRILLEHYAVDSYPPHQVYAFYTRIGTPNSYRVLLTMDESDQVVSFMAEETAITG